MKSLDQMKLKVRTGKLALIALKSVLRWATGQSSKITASQIITLLTVAQYEGQKLSFYVDKTGQLKEYSIKTYARDGSANEAL